MAAMTEGRVSLGNSVCAAKFIRTATVSEDNCVCVVFS